jgi:hypothetical protein
MSSGTDDVKYLRNKEKWQSCPPLERLRSNNWACFFLSKDRSGSRQGFARETPLEPKNRSPFWSQAGIRRGQNGETAL